MIKAHYSLHRFSEKHLITFGRFALFLVYFWFGALKIIGTSPAGAMVRNLFDATIHFMPFGTFYTLFSLFEMLIGVLFLFQKTQKAAITLFLLHMITTMLPLFLLPEMTWQAVFTPTLEGQYILKNIVLIALALLVSQKTPHSHHTI